MINILIVDDHKIVRDGIRSQLQHEDKYVIVAEASNGVEALEALKELLPDIVLMDLNMDKMNGIVCTGEISKLYPEVKVVALTMLNENQHIKQMLKAGASGYLLKNCSEKELRRAIDTIYEGGTYYSPEVTQVIMSSLERQKSKTTNQSYFIQLTKREKEVLQLILKEYSNEEIASELFISKRTVDAHKRNLLEKTGSKNIAGLVLYAINNKVITDW